MEVEHTPSSNDFYLVLHFRLQPFASLPCLACSRPVDHEADHECNQQSCCTAHVDPNAESNHRHRSLILEVHINSIKMKWTPKQCCWQAFRWGGEATPSQDSRKIGISLSLVNSSMVTSGMHHALAHECAGSLVIGYQYADITHQKRQLKKWNPTRH